MMFAVARGDPVVVPLIALECIALTTPLFRRSKINSNFVLCLLALNTLGLRLVYSTGYADYSDGAFWATIVAPLIFAKVLGW